MVNTIEIKNHNIPKHIAIIMDGNGRWANSKGLPRIAGHREGVRAVRRVTQICAEIGIEILTLYTFSSENWGRPDSEVSALMKLLVTSLKKELNELSKKNVKFTTIGDHKKLSSKVQNELLAAIDKTKNNTGLNLNLALNYGSREEILNAVKVFSKKLLEKKVAINQLNESFFSNMLYTKNIPDPDLLIRTGGEFRISNFLLWQIAYTEIHVTNTYWPAFDKNDLYKSINDFQNRERRFGKISEQVEV